MAKSLPSKNISKSLKEQLPDLFESYKGLNLTTPSSWILLSGDKFIIELNQICHALLYNSGPGWDELILPVPRNDELSLEYLRMLIKGPFRSLSDLIKLDRIHDNYYLHCLSLERWPANVLMNFCIASRFPIEFKFLLKPWAKRLEGGFEPTLAFLLTYSYGYNYPTKTQYPTRTFKMSKPGHMWIDPSSDWRKILSGNMVDTSASFKANPKLVTPTNIIWGRSVDYLNLQTMTDEEITEFYHQPVIVPTIKPPVIMDKLTWVNIEPPLAPEHEPPNEIDDLEDEFPFDDFDDENDDD